MARVGLVPVLWWCPACSPPVQLSMCSWAVFLLSVILRWLPPPPRVWSLAASFSCPAGLKLACMEPGVSPGVCVCVCACAPMCKQVRLPTQELSPPCLAGERWDRNGPPADQPQQGPMSDCPYLSLCFWATFPEDMGLLPSSVFPDGGEHWIVGNVLISFAITYVC